MGLSRNSNQNFLNTTGFNSSIELSIEGLQLVANFSIGELKGLFLETECWLPRLAKSGIHADLPRYSKSCFSLQTNLIPYIGISIENVALAEETSIRISSFSLKSW